YLDPVTGGDTIWIVDRHGKVVLDSSSFPGSGVSVADRAYFAAGQRDTGVFVGPAIRSRLTGRIVITLTRGLRDPEGRFDGIAGINIDADWLL
ncbi:PDC sensor domain-containing protein, partial [Vibrio parahaemolyticus]